MESQAGSLTEVWGPYLLLPTLGQRECSDREGPGGALAERGVWQA